MSMRRPAGFISPNYDPLKNPDAPTSVTASGGDTSASVSFTAPANVGGSAITAYYAVSNPSRITVSGASSPITVTGLTNGTAYTFQVWALNSYGPGAWSAASGSVTPVGARGLFGGGYTGSTGVNVIDYVIIDTLGNASDFGDLQDTTSSGNKACSSTTRAIWRQGSTLSAVITYTSTTTPGNATSFGDLTVAREVNTSFSNSTRGLFSGGTTGTGNNTIDYITIATTGNATDFGDTTVANWSGATACASSTRGINAAGGEQNSGATMVNTITYVTIATLGNAASFGQLTMLVSSSGGCSSSTRGLFGGGWDSGYVRTNTIGYITIATLGNATDFGDLSVTTTALTSCSSNIRGLFAGGTTGSASNVIDYVTIATTGNATDFGDLTVARWNLAACSSGHGGLQ